MTAKTASPGPAATLTAARVNWMILLILGLMIAGLGIYLLVQPATAAILLVKVVGVYWLIAGLVELIGAGWEKQGAMRMPRLIGAIGAIISGALVVFSMLIGQAVVPTLMRLLLGLTALLLGVINIAIGIDRAAPARGRLIIGLVYALLGLVLLIDPALMPSLLFPLLGILLLVAGGYAVYLAIKGRKEGAVGLRAAPAAASPEAQKQASLDQARQDIETITQKARNADIGSDGQG